MVDGRARAQLRSSEAAARERADAADAAARTMRTALGVVRRTVEEEKSKWLRELRKARDEACQLRIELARERARNASTTREEEESELQSSSEEVDETEMGELEQAAETLRELSLALREAAIERRVRETKSPLRALSIEAAKLNKPPTPAGETAKRAMRLRHAFKAVNYAEPSLKVKMRRPVDDGVPFKRRPAKKQIETHSRMSEDPGSPKRSSASMDSLDAICLSPSPSSQSPAEIVALVPSVKPLFASSPARDRRPPRASSRAVNYAEPDLIHKMRRP